MQPDINAQLGTFFDDDTPHPPFSQKMRGYDQDEVEAHLRALDSKIRAVRENEQALKQELAFAHRQMQEQERPTYSGLGSRVEQLLRLAGEQRDEILQEARTEASPGPASAKAEAAEPRAGGEQGTAEPRGNAKREAGDV